VYQIDGLTPVVPDESYVHPTAVLIGDVILGKGVYVGPNASLRGDFGRIVIKDGANIQDNCVMHGFPEQDTVVEEDGHIGHSAILHGCVVRRNALVGMNAVVMDGAVIGENSIVGAAAFVKAKAEMPANYLIIGSPAKAIRELSEQEMVWKKQGTREYQVLVERCKKRCIRLNRYGRWRKDENDCPSTKAYDRNQQVNPRRKIIGFVLSTGNVPVGPVSAAPPGNNVCAGSGVVLIRHFFTHSHLLHISSPRVHFYTVGS
jgi:phenylacetic acid degradation protein PaaY